MASCSNSTSNIRSSFASQKSYTSSSPSSHRQQSQRMLMRDWLMDQIDSGSAPGLEWLGSGKTYLKIPWIHGSKAVWSRDNHCKLFENWAIHTGKYKPGEDRDNPKRWKANFRCALNSLPDVHEERSMSNKNGDQGFTVYRFDPPITSPPKASCKTKEERRIKAVKRPVQIPETEDMRRHDAAVSLQMIADDACRRVAMLKAHGIDVQDSSLIDMQHEVIVENVPTTVVDALMDSDLYTDIESTKEDRRPTPKVKVEIKDHAYNKMDVKDSFEVGKKTAKGKEKAPDTKQLELNNKSQKPIKISESVHETKMSPEKITISRLPTVVQQHVGEMKSDDRSVETIHRTKIKLMKMT